MLASISPSRGIQTFNSLNKSLQANLPFKMGLWHNRRVVYGGVALSTAVVSAVALIFNREAGAEPHQPSVPIPQPAPYAILEGHSSPFVSDNVSVLSGANVKLNPSEINPSQLMPDSLTSYLPFVGLAGVLSFIGIIVCCRSTKKNKDVKNADKKIDEEVKKKEDKGVEEFFYKKINCEGSISIKNLTEKPYPYSTINKIVQNFLNMKEISQMDFLNIGYSFGKQILNTVKNELLPIATEMLVRPNHQNKLIQENPKVNSNSQTERRESLVIELTEIILQEEASSEIKEENFIDITPLQNEEGEEISKTNDNTTEEVSEKTEAPIDLLALNVEEMKSLDKETFQSLVRDNPEIIKKLESAQAYEALIDKLEEDQLQYIKDEQIKGWTKEQLIALHHSTFIELLEFNPTSRVEIFKEKGCLTESAETENQQTDNTVANV